MREKGVVIGMMRGGGIVRVMTTTNDGGCSDDTKDLLKEIWAQTATFVKCHPLTIKNHSIRVVQNVQC